jgi:hypothetical protein
MRSKNSRTITAAEREHIARVKSLPCSVCDESGPSDAHHIVQGQHWTVVALCKDCHQNSVMGWHGQRRMWAITKMDELSALAVTIRRLTESMHKGLACLD